MPAPRHRPPSRRSAPAPPPAPQDTRDALDLSAEENASLCSGCVRCCSYITIEVQAPRSARDYDQWMWAIMHRGVSLYVEIPERWFVALDTPCENLTAEGRCGIYGRHPVLCREYDPRDCERRRPLEEVRAWFHTAEALENWLRRERPAHHRALLRWRRDSPNAPPRADVEADRRAARRALVTIGEPMRPAPVRASSSRRGGSLR
ncbi:MAG: YkgJ family cysteine cluster protein [Candidatus Eisenbacteria bacterium]